MSDGVIDLAYAIDSLRNELTKAVESGKGKSLCFDVKDIEMEFAIGLEEVKGDKAGINFSILGLGGGYDVDDKLTTKHQHTIKLRLTPNSNIQISSGTGQLPDD